MWVGEGMRDCVDVGGGGDELDVYQRSHKSH